MLDALVVGAGPAGSVAATVLARAGCRVRLIDRATFPRDKLCGDTVNPGTLAVLKRLGLSAAIDARGLRVNGMLLTGPNGVSVVEHYPHALCGRAIVRRDVDWALLLGAVAAGADFAPAVAARAAIVDEVQGRAMVRGVTMRARDGSTREIRARVTIAADGRRSTVAFGLQLARHPDRPRRWAVGSYFESVGGLSTFGEMHVRRDHYIGVAPVPDGLVNVCLVIPSQAGDPRLRDPAALLTAHLARDVLLRDRFAGARIAQPPIVLGPLAVDARESGIDGLLLAGDAAGFIDPMTGDGLRFAVRGGELAACVALESLERGWSGAHRRFALRRRREFGGKWRFNRMVRRLVASPISVDAAEFAARVAPSVLRAMIAHAGDCGLCSLPVS
jgi:flavin-dependent dehydrogenase